MEMVKKYKFYIFSIIAIIFIVISTAMLSEAKPHIHERVIQLVNKNPSLKPLYDNAMSDGKLTNYEALSFAKYKKE